MESLSRAGTMPEATNPDMVAIGSILGRLGWQTLGLDETDRRARDKKRGPTL